MIFTSLRDAARYAGVTRAAVLYWTELHDIGELVDGRWHIDREKLDAFLAARRQLVELRQSMRKSA